MTKKKNKKKNKSKPANIGDKDKEDDVMKNQDGVVNASLAEERNALNAAVDEISTSALKDVEDSKAASDGKEENNENDAGDFLGDIDMSLPGTSEDISDQDKKRSGIDQGVESSRDGNEVVEIEHLKDSEKEINEKKVKQETVDPSYNNRSYEQNSCSLRITKEEALTMMMPLLSEDIGGAMADESNSEKQLVEGSQTSYEDTVALISTIEKSVSNNTPSKSEDDPWSSFDRGHPKPQSAVVVEEHETKSTFLLCGNIWNWLMDRSCWRRK